MKKTILFICALIASIGAMAQEPTNLARIDGTTATDSGHEGAYIAANAIDGNTGTRWGTNYERNTDTEWLQIKWSSAQTFNTVKLLCEGAMNAANAPLLAFDIQTSDNGTDWTTKKSVTGQNAENNEYITVILDEAVTSTYVRFQGVKKGNYGYSLYEFEVYNIDYSIQTLTSFIVPNPDKANATLTTCKVGEQITIQAIDQNSTVINSGVNYTATNGTITDAGVFTPSAAGVCTITATQGGTQLTATVVAYDGESLLAGKTGITNSDATGVNLFNNGNWGDRGGLGSPTDDHTWLYYDLNAYYTIDLVDLKQEQACGKNYSIQFSADGSIWTNAYVVTNEAGMAGDVRHYFYGSDQNTNVRFVRFDCTEPATQYGVSIYEIAAYGTKTGDLVDNNSPIISTASAGSITPFTVVLTLKATDDVASTINYAITDTSHGIDIATIGANGATINYTVAGLSPNTEYSFTIVASDGNNSSDASVVNFTTSTMADVPSAITATETISIYSGRHGNTTGYGFYDWGGGSGAATDINGVNAYLISGFKYFGSQFNELNVSEMDMMHLDIYPLYTGKLCIVPINHVTEGDGNQPEKGFNFDVIAGSWNQLEIPVANITARGTTMTRLYQIKYIGEMVSANVESASDGFANADGTVAFIVGNVYFYKDATISITPTYNKTTYVTTAALDFTAVDGLKAYVATAANAANVTMTKVEESVPAGTPLLLIGTAGTTYNVPVVATASAPAENLLRAGDGTTVIGGTSKYDYILYSDGLFYRANEGALAAGKAYLHLDSAPAGARSLNIVFDDEEVTGVEKIKRETISNSQFFDLQGRKVANPTKGMYIVNGKKVIVK